MSTSTLADTFSPDPIRRRYHVSQAEEVVRYLDQLADEFTNSFDNTKLEAATERGLSALADALLALTLGYEVAPPEDYRFTQDEWPDRLMALTLASALSLHLSTHRDPEATRQYLVIEHPLLVLNVIQRSYDVAADLRCVSR